MLDMSVVFPFYTTSLPLVLSHHCHSVSSKARRQPWEPSAKPGKRGWRGVRMMVVIPAFLRDGLVFHFKAKFKNRMHLDFELCRMHARYSNSFNHIWFSEIATYRTVEVWEFGSVLVGVLHDEFWEVCWLIFEESDTVDKNSCPQIAMVNRLTLIDLVWRLYWVGAPKASYKKLYMRKVWLLLLLLLCFESCICISFRLPPL